MPNFLDCCKAQAYARFMEHALLINPLWKPVRHKTKPIEIDTKLESLPEISILMTQPPMSKKELENENVVY